MDRDRLARWLGADHRTFWWRHDDDYDRYEGVETGDAGLRYFKHSHVPGEDGVYAEAQQSYADFAARGPLWPMPDDKDAALRAWVRAWLARGDA